MNPLPFSKKTKKYFSKFYHARVLSSIILLAKPPLFRGTKNNPQMKVVLVGALVNQKEFEPLESLTSTSVTMPHTKLIRHERFSARLECTISSLKKCLIPFFLKTLLTQTGSF
jgi:hypothetical protein